MHDTAREHLLELLDHHRGLGGRLGESGDVVRELALDRSECRIVAARASPSSISALVANETALADRQRYKLEWKVYGHDRPVNLTETLLAAGFAADDEEQVLIRRLTGTPGDASQLDPEVTIVRVTDDLGLAEVAEISRDIGRKDVNAKTRRLAGILRAGCARHHEETLRT